MTDWRTSLQGSAAEFAEQLEDRGFTPDEEPRRWSGGLTTASGDHDLTVEIGVDFPFYPPKVRLDPPPDTLTWHLERDGGLCLYTQEGRYGLPWATANGLLKKVEDWFEQSQAGWPNDPGELDLERYFPLMKDRFGLVTYDDIDELVGHILTLDERHPKLADVISWVHVERGGRLTRQYERHNEQWAYAVDVGLLERPVWDWPSLTDALGDVPDRLQQLATTHDRGLLMVRYEREGTEGHRVGAIALEVYGADEPELGYVPIAEDSAEARRRPRAGPDAGLLSRKTVAIIGCGAIGSFLADALARSGIGWLILVDADYLRPGNCVRHLCGPEYVPLLKTEAVRMDLDRRDVMDKDFVDAHAKRLTGELTVRLFGQADVLVDATAEPSVDEMLYHYAQLAGQQYVKVSLHRDGNLARIDRVGPGSSPIDDRPDPIPAPERSPDWSPHREVGCGDPISPTPPWAVIEAASATCRWVIDTLRPARRRQLPDATVQVLRPEPDDLYQTAGSVT